MKTYLKNFVITLIFAAIVFCLARDLVVRPFLEGYKEHGIIGGIGAVVIYLLIAAGLCRIIIWALDDKHGNQKS